MTITKLPGVSERIETGALQFGDDWPGVFIRGDDALGLCNSIEVILRCIPENALPERALLQFVINTLECCRVPVVKEVLFTEPEDGHEA